MGHWPACKHSPSTLFGCSLRGERSDYSEMSLLQSHARQHSPRDSMLSDRRAGGVTSSSKTHHALRVLKRLFIDHRMEDGTPFYTDQDLQMVIIVHTAADPLDTSIPPYCHKGLLIGGDFRWMGPSLALRRRCISKREVLIMTDPRRLVPRRAKARTTPVHRLSIDDHSYN